VLADGGIEVTAAALHTVMTDAEYEVAREKLRATYGDSRAEAGARFEQALATLFHRSGWTQEKLAEKEGKDRRYTGRLLCFGRFLNFGPMGPNPELALTERKFRDYWDQTTGDERGRFREVLRLIKSSIPGRKLNVASKIIEHFADGKWHSLDAIAEKIDAPRKDIEHTFALMIGKPRNYKAKCEKKPVGKSFSYRLFKQHRAIAASELLEKLAPIVKGLEEQGRRNMVTVSLTAVAVFAGQLRKLLDEWTE